MTASTADAGLPPPAATKSPVFSVLQRLGRSLMLPIAVLPAAALLLRFGQPDMLGSNGDAAGGLADVAGFGWLADVAPVIAAAGDALFANLPLLFAIGVAIGFARRSDGSTALAALVGYLVFDRVTKVMFAGSRISDKVMTGYAPSPDDPQRFEPTLNFAAANPTGVLGGIVIGITAALLWQRYYRIKLPAWLAFFGGRRFVPIITAVAALVIGVIFGWVWPPIGDGLEGFGDWLGTNATLGAGIYGMVNRLLIPLGLHHFVNSIVWFTVPDCQVGGTTAHGDLNCYFAGQDGAGTFMAGFFPIMMFALPAAALAIWRAAPPHRRGAIGGIMITAAAISFVTGITEPIEFAFLFVAPVLFAVHIVLTGVALALASALNIKLGFGFSAGLTDYILNFNKANTHNPLLVIVLGLIFAAIYYVVFSALIRVMNIPTPGREPEADTDSGEPAAVAAPSGAPAGTTTADRPAVPGGAGGAAPPASEPRS